ncbi:MAG: DUF692 family multinuclear iron-containing protein [Bacteroidota bacterium]
MPEIFSSVACNLDTNILSATLPLFESEKVQAIEWSFDTLFKHTAIPEWFIELLHTFSNENRLIGHGIFFSLFSGKWSAEQQAWLDSLKDLSSSFRFDHITEHFGFMTGEDFHKGAPISIPYTSSTLAIGRDRLKRIQNVCNCPVGLENLAFSYSIEEVKKHGDFLDQLVGSINGFIILDLHNLFCQLHNFDIEYDDIINLYPLDKVREIHISGGSWEDVKTNPGKKIRRDTHDDAVPEEVFQLLEKTIPICSNLKYVVLEQISSGLDTIESRSSFQKDFYRMDEIVQRIHPAKQAENSFLPENSLSAGIAPLEDDLLYSQQLQLSAILENAVSYEEALRLLHESQLANSSWEIEKWNPSMLETAINIAQKWKYGFR